MNLSAPWELKHISSYVYYYLLTNKMYILSQENECITCCILSPTIAMIVHRYILYYIKHCWNEYLSNRRMHSPVFMILWLISGSIFDGEGLGCTKWVIIKIWKWSQREREEQKIWLVHQLGNSKKKSLSLLSSLTVFLFSLFLTVSSLYFSLPSFFLHWNVTTSPESVRRDTVG